MRAQYRESFLSSTRTMTVSMQNRLRTSLTAMAKNTENTWHRLPAVVEISIRFSFEDIFQGRVTQQGCYDALLVAKYDLYIR